MAATTMMFGPEWMRTKQTPRTANPPSPPPQTPGTPAEKNYDGTMNAYAYSKEEMLRIYKEGGGRGGLGLEIERWDGVVRQVGSEPAALKEPTEAERKLFAGPLNSELRRRQSTEQFSPLVIGGVKPNGATAASPMRERFTNIARRRDSSDTGGMSLPIPRKLSLTGAQLGSPRESAMPSPRTRGPVTPGGIDGVLSGAGDSWMARRRASEAGKALPTPRADDGGEQIKEEDETGADISDNWRAKAPKTDDPAPAAGKPLKDDQPVTNGGPAPVKPPGLPLDVAAIDWQYLDPQGNIQGPFRADVMSQWHIQGYFAMDLLMKRANIDADWTQFGVLIQRLGTQNVFLTPFDPIQPTPPGLPQQPDPSQQAANNNLGNAPFQPVPQRQSQVAALEAYYSQSPASHSPASSFGGGRLGNNSPDPSVFARGGVTDSPRGPRAVFTQDGGLGRRQPNFGPAEPGYEQSLDPVYASANASRFGPVRTASTDGYGIGSTAGFAAGSPWAQNGLNGLNIRTNSLDSYGTQQQQPFGGHGHLNDASSGFAHSPLARTPGTGVASAADAFLPREVGRPSPAPFDAAPQQFTQSPSLAYAQAQGQPAPSQGSQWGTPQPQPAQAVKRAPAPIDPSSTFPTSRNTISLRDRDSWAPPAPAPAPVAAPPQSSTQTQDGKSPWSNTAQTVVEEGWREVQGPNSLTVSNLGQHNLSLLKEEAAAKAAAASALAVVETPGEEKGGIELPVQAEGAAKETAKDKETVKEEKKEKESAKSKRKAATAAAPAPAPEPAIEPSPSTPADANGAPKVWASGAAGEEKKMSLREIQEAETRRLEERKAAERERRLMQQTAPSAQTTSAVDGGDIQQISWGLPTSKVGAAATAKPSSPVKEVKGEGAKDVWGGGGGVNGAGKKKSMKEIQEEEERRKAKEARDAAARSKMYAETTTKVAPSPAPAIGGAWTTVGAPAAKTVAATVTTTARPSPAPAAAAAAARKPVTPVPAPVPTPVAVKPAAIPKPAPAPKIEVAPAAPSAEFMKWLSDNLKALSNGVEYDAIVSMLLSFPLDVDPSTSELISDLIYANSATLDGRRFAAEFASRRKADAMRKTGGGMASIADIVKQTPKPSAGNEWGGFKVVNKKKKGGRA
ncbi:hypothetical protein PENSPDRAFT_621850 [Peniophora sp. CONT]|nr:hypothetical protein PENSPDRAFT_621850 [Peniophora sp. CONT]